MKSTEMLSRKLVWVICLLLFHVSNLSSKPFSTTVIASPSSESPQDAIPNVINKNNENERASSPSSPLDSIWKTFKDVIESTTSVLSSSLSSSGSVSSHEEDHSVIRSERQIKDDMFNRRGLLMEQSLIEHYTHQFFDFFPQLKEYLLIAEEENFISEKKGSTEKIQARASPTNLDMLRWVQPDPIDSVTKCYCFSESRDSHWSFQWCPQKRTIFQGQRTKDGKLVPSFNLGTLSSPNGNAAKDKDNVLGITSDTSYLVTTAKANYPSAIAIHPYLDGDTCVESGLQRRISVVVLHRSASTKCSLGKGGETFLESVVEVRACQYMLHVCLDSWKDTVDLPQNDKTNYKEESPLAIKHRAHLITESGLEQMNQTLHYIKNHIIGSFARKSRADARGKSRDNILTSLHSALPPFPQTRIESNLKLIKNMFMHAYDSYMYHGYPASEVKPISCGPATFNLVKIPGLTLIDSLDTLVILGNYTEFARSVERLRFLNDNVYEETGLFTTGSGLFDVNYNVSVFETNIRVLGGLLSAHQLAAAFMADKVLKKEIWAKDRSILLGSHHEKEGESASSTPSIDCDDTSTTSQCKQESFPKNVHYNHTDQYWVYDDFLLELARDIGDRLLPAFDTKTGIPYGSINLMHGVPKGETPIASLAGGGTLTLEMELLSRLTGNNEYGRAAKLATRAFWMRRSTHGLLGKHICTRTGTWTESLSGIGSNSDSFYEYLIKHHILFPEDSDFWFQLVAAYGGLYNETRIGEWYGDVEMRRGKKQKGAPRRVFEALAAFYPGMQVLLGEITPAARTLNSFFLVREYLGFLPERFDFGAWKVDHGGGIHFLRPELLESAYFLHRSSKGFQNNIRSRRNSCTSDSSGWVWSGDFALHAIEKLTRTKCGYASVRGVSPKTTGKLKADRNRIGLMDEMPSFFLSETLKYLYLLFDDENILHTDENHDWVFTTEAHPIHNEPKQVSVDAKLMEQAQELKSRIQRRLDERKKPVYDLNQGLLEEKWTEESKVRDFGLQLKSLIKNVGKLYEDRRLLERRYSQHDTLFSTAVERLFPNDNSLSPFDVYSERLYTANPTYLSFRKLGNELDLTHSCPNLYASNFLWIRALNGGIADYSDSYKSRTDDDFLVSESDIIQLGSVDALALHGAGVHIQSLYDAFYQIRHPIQDKKIRKDKDPYSASRNTKGQEENRNGVTRFDMGTDMGSFDVSAFPGGSGFFVQHVESGETVITTLIEEEPTLGNQQGPFILVYSTSDAGTQVTGISRGYSVVDQDHRAVVLADVHGNSYSCQVQIMESKIHVEEDSSCDAPASSSPECISSETKDKIVHEFPCSPALFGPSHISHLQKVDIIEVKAKIQSSGANDKQGCGRFSMSPASNGSVKEPNPLDDSSSHCDIIGDEKSSLISLVERGDCTFQEKSFNKKITEGSKGVIVMNNNKGDDLFVMSGGGSKEITSLDREDYPVTVLVTWDDGQKILKTMSSHESKNDDTQLFAKISLVQDQVPPDSELKGSKSKFWPRVKASPDVLQIYSRSGWGIQAVQGFADGNTQAQWQLYLLQHGLAEETVYEGTNPTTDVDIVNG